MPGNWCLLVHPVLKQRVGDPQLAQPGRRMEAIGAVERQLALQPNEPALAGFPPNLVRGLAGGRIFRGREERRARRFLYRLCGRARHGADRQSRRNGSAAASFSAWRRGAAATAAVDLPAAGRSLRQGGRALQGQEVFASLFATPVWRRARRTCRPISERSTSRR